MPGSQRVGVVEGSLGGPERTLAIGALFPQVEFTTLARGLPDRGALRGLALVIVPIHGRDAAEVDAAAAWLKTRERGVGVVVALADADVGTTRRLMREGAADVLPAPVSEAALALSLERLLEGAGAGGAGPGPAKRAGELVAFLKAGGGVGATSLAAQTAMILAGRGQGDVCLADLDLQFGGAGVHLDMADAVTVTDVLSTGAALAETPFASYLSRHRSGVRLLAAPNSLTPLESVSIVQADALLGALRREFRLTLFELPSVWTAWTNRALQMSDRIVLVTQLSVPSLRVLQRQMQVLEAQGLNDRPVVLVCNAVSGDQQSVLPMRAAERAVGRPFDVVIPEDRKIMYAATNQGLQLSAVRRGTKLEKAIAQLADRIGAPAAAERR